MNILVLFVKYNKNTFNRVKIVFKSVKYIIFNNYISNGFNELLRPRSLCTAW